MPSISVGDLRQHLMLSRNTTLLKQRMNLLAEQMASGEYKDRVAVTGGDTKRLDDIDRQLKLVDAQMRAATDIGQRLSMTQKVLDGVEVTRNAMTQALILGVLVMLVWGRWRYDIVAFAALVIAVIAGLVPSDQAFTGFGHPATIVIALVLVLSLVAVLYLTVMRLVSEERMRDIILYAQVAMTIMVILMASMTSLLI